MISPALVSASYTLNASIAGSLINGASRTGTLSLLDGSTTLASVNVATAATNNSGQYALTVPSGSLARQPQQLEVSLQRRLELQRRVGFADADRREHAHDEHWG